MGPAFLGPDVPGDGTVVVQGPGVPGRRCCSRPWPGSCRDGRDPRGRPRPPRRAPADVTGDLAVVVDDAHRLTAADAARVGELAALPGVRVLLAHRPWPRPPALLELLDRLRGAGVPAHVVVLGHAGPRAVGRWAAEQLGRGRDTGARATSSSGRPVACRRWCSPSCARSPARGRERSAACTTRSDGPARGPARGRRPDLRRAGRARGRRPRRAARAGRRRSPRRRPARRGARRVDAARRPTSSRGCGPAGSCSPRAS